MNYQEFAYNVLLESNQIPSDPFERFVAKIKAGKELDKVNKKAKEALSHERVRLKNMNTKLSFKPKVEKFSTPSRKKSKPGGIDRAKEGVARVGSSIRRKGTKIAKGGKVGRLIGRQIERAGTSIAMRPGRTIKGAAIATGVGLGTEGIRRTISRREKKL
jgi:hypothetical protein